MAYFIESIIYFGNFDNQDGQMSVSASSPNSDAQQTTSPMTVPMPRPMRPDLIDPLGGSSRRLGGTPAAVIDLTEECDSPEHTTDRPGGTLMNRNELICSVCLECRMDRMPTSTSCGHLFCRECIMQLRRCAVCNAATRPDLIDPLGGSSRRLGGTPAAVIDLTEECDSPERVDTHEAGANIASGSAKHTTDRPGGTLMNRNELICSVCLECLVDRMPTSTSCGHLFCRECIMQLRRCAVCNAAIRPNSVHRIYFN